MSLNMQTNNDNSAKDNSISAEFSNQEEKDKLLDEIAMLKAQVSLLETMIETPKFDQLKFGKVALTHGSKTSKFYIPDVQTELCYEFYRFVGLRCLDFDQNSRFIFEISNTEQNVTKNDPYGIEILIDESGRGKLGKWVLPMAIDVQKILSQYPIENLSNVKYFLKSCKHHIDCYLCRLKQFEELQELLSGIKNVLSFHNLDVTIIELLISGIKNTDTDELLDVILYLYYKSTTARPYKLSSDTSDDERPSPILVKKLNKYFKPFLMNSLSLAFLQVSESQTTFVWQKIMANDNEDITEIFDRSDDEDAGFLTEFLQQDNKKRQKKSKNKVQNEEINLPETIISLPNEDENSKSFNDTENTTRDDCSEEIRIKSRKRKRLAKTVVNSNKVRKSQVGLKRIRNGMSNREKNSDQNVADIDPISNVASGVEPATLQKKKSKVCKTSVQRVQMEDNYNRKKDLPKKTTDKNKKSHTKLLSDSNNNANCKRSVDYSQKVIEKKKTITRTDQIKEKKKSNISKLKNKRAKISCSTPVSGKLSNKSHFFHEVSSIITEEK